MSKKDERLFNPVRVQKKGQWKFIILGFLAFFLIFGSATLVYLSSKVDNFSMDKIMSVFEKEEDNSIDDAQTGKKATILFMSVSSSKTVETGKREIYFLMLAQGNSASNQVKLYPLQVKDSYINHFETGGENEVVRAISSEYGIEIDRYVSSDENTFALAINYMGGLEYTVPERVEYRTQDLTLILTPGKQTLKGESLLKYLKYFKETDLSGQSRLFDAMVNDYFTADNMEDPMKIYKGVLGEIAGRSNISFVDTADRLETIRQIALRENTKTIAVNSIDSFK